MNYKNKYLKYKKKYLELKSKSKKLKENNMTGGSIKKITIRQFPINDTFEVNLNMDINHKDLFKFLSERINVPINNITVNYLDTNLWNGFESKYNNIKVKDGPLSKIDNPLIEISTFRQFRLKNKNETIPINVIDNSMTTVEGLIKNISKETGINSNNFKLKDDSENIIWDGENSDFRNELINNKDSLFNGKRNIDLLISFKE